MQSKLLGLISFVGVSLVAACTTAVDITWPDKTGTPSATTPPPTPTPDDALLIGISNTCWSLTDSGGDGTYPTVFSGSGRQVLLEDTGTSPRDDSRLLLLQVQSDEGAEGYFQVALVEASTSDGRGNLQVELYDTDPSGSALAFRTQYRTDAIRKAQACTFPLYRNVDLVGDVVAAAWDGTVGGVVAFEATGTVTSSGGRIDVDGAGFRGGIPTAVSPTPAACATPVTETTDFLRAGRRGEGTSTTTSLFGTLPVGNGGGGGSCRSFGGGGGGSGGSGGTGGDSGLGDPTGGGGQGGSAVPGSGGPRLTFGGGGGAGHVNATVLQEGTRGGAGGGVVWIIADDYDDAVHGITAKGTTTVGSPTNTYGHGGGGAGGSVLLDVTSAVLPSAAPTIDASGGAGGSSANPGACGAGGGGAGGRITAPTSFLKNISGGTAGSCNTLPSASPGQAGVTLDN